MTENHFVEAMKVQPYVDTLSYDIFLDESVSSPEYYRNVIGALNKANENDSVNLFINSNGGLVSTATAIIHAMDRCRAKITAHLVGDCCSAATMIALHASAWEISENVTFMVHTCSFGVFNSAEKIKDHHDFIQKQNRETMFREYSGLMSDEEIEECLAGREFWFGKEELEERLQTFIEYRQEKQTTAMESLMEEQFAEEDAFVEAAIIVAQDKGIITEEEATVARKMQQVMDTVLDNHKDAIESLLSEQPIKDAKSLTTFAANPTPDKDDVPSFTIYDDCDEPLAIISYEQDSSGAIENIELELFSDGEVFLIDQVLLADYPKSDLKMLADKLGVGYPHNIGDVKLAEKIYENILKDVVYYSDNN